MYVRMSTIPVGNVENDLTSILQFSFSSIIVHLFNVHLLHESVLWQCSNQVSYEIVAVVTLFVTWIFMNSGQKK